MISLWNDTETLFPNPRVLHKDLYELRYGQKSARCSVLVKSKQYPYYFFILNPIWVYDKSMEILFRGLKNA